MENPLVSVCMTTYNHEAYLAQAIEGVLSQQTDFGVELVVGEDCSTDGTRAVCERYAARYPDRIRLVTSGENVGWRANYRRTFEACRGKYVAYCDGDDWWSDPRKLQMQVEVMESDATCGMCYTSVNEYMQASGELLPDPDRHYTDFENMLLGISVPNCTTLARRELIAAYYAEIRPEEHPEWLTDDWPMWLWFAWNSRICFLDRVTLSERPAQELEGTFDRILLDVPCSNTGVLGRRPDARWAWTPARLRRAVALQAEILEACARLLAPGGRLVYSTCSIEPEEDGDQIQAFLTRHPGFTLLDSRLTLPSPTHDGSFAALLQLG